MELEMLMLNKISQTQKDKYHMFPSYVESIGGKWQNESSKETFREKNQEEEGGRRRIM